MEKSKLQQHDEEEFDKNFSELERQNEEKFQKTLDKNHGDSMCGLGGELYA